VTPSVIVLPTTTVEVAEPERLGEALTTVEVWLAALHARVTCLLLASPE